MTIPAFILHVRAEGDPNDVIRRLRAWLKAGLRRHGLRCTSIVEHQQERRRGMTNKPRKLIRAAIERATVGVIEGLACPNCQRGITAHSFEILDTGASAICGGCHSDLVAIELER